MDIIAKIKEDFNNGEFDNFITEINLPYFKNIKIGSRINFTFPLTVLIGQNGCGKSSCLQAIKGCPEGNSPSENWFSTPIDEITQKDVSSKYPKISAVWPTIWYKYKNGDSEYEVLYQAVYRKNDPDYWEKREPVQSYGMTTKIRDPRISKNVVYIDFRGELSAFDKYFYFGERHTKPNVSSNKKQDYLRYQGQKLKKVFNEGKQYPVPYSNGTKYYNELPIDFTEEELECINQILGKNYTEAQLVYHHLFESFGASILFKTANLNYSEAFAGSGEMSASILVHKVLNAPEGSLILLDEPEVSLHPLAQEKLRDFLLKQILEKRLQVVVSTHSPSFVNRLPKEAIKVFREESSGAFEVLADVSYQAAFKVVGFSLLSTPVIFVEDNLAKNIIAAVRDKYKEEESINYENISIKTNFGGADNLYQDAASLATRFEDNVNRNYYFALDGDKKTETEFLNLSTIRDSEISLNLLEDNIKNVTGISRMSKLFVNDSNTPNHILIEQRKLFINYAKNHLSYLPANKPEEIIWSDEYCRNKLEALEISNLQQHLENISTMDNYKEKFRYLAQIIYEDDSSRNIECLEKEFIRKWIKSNSPYISQIKVNILDKII